MTIMRSSSEVDVVTPPAKVALATSCREGTVRRELAREILGVRNFFDPEDIKAMFGYTYHDSGTVPYSATRLERALHMGHGLVYNPPGISVGWIVDKVQNRIEGEGHQPLLQLIEWCESEPFFRNEFLPGGWCLMGLAPIADSLGEDSIGQTRAIVRHLDQIYGRVVPEVVVERVNEFDQQVSELSARAEDEVTDLRVLAGRVMSLGVNRHHRASAVQILWTAVLRYFKTREMILSKFYALTNTCSREGIVRIGRLEGRGGVLNPRLVTSSGARTGAIFCQYAASHTS